MGGFSSRVWKFAGASALLIGAVAGATGTASAGQASQIGGAATCDAETGQTIITWTFINNSPDDVALSNVVIDGSGLLSGSSLDATATFSPAPAPAQGTATAISHATGDASGNISLTLLVTPLDLTPFTVTGIASPEGGCSLTTTTAPTTTTTAPPVTTDAPTTTADLSAGNGNLPGTGYDGTTLMLAFALVGVGGALLLIRRRHSTS